MSDSPRERYRLERKISGKGSFGEVWLATDTLLDRPVAVKCPKVTDDPIRRERFLVEARMLARLNHPNITQIHDAFFNEEEGNLYLVMEYVDGRDLSEIIGAGTSLPLDIILEVAVGILRALSYAHQQDVVHRDVKPANVMIADDVKLTDFGLASLRSILDRGTGFMAGTPAYMAPEQIEGQAIDGRADLYALGVLLYEMLSGGRLPFEHADQIEMMDAHLYAAPPPIAQFARTVPPALEQVVMRLLAKDPQERYPSAEAVIGILESIPAGPKLTNLPVSLIPFVGREAELAEIQDRLGDPDCRLLTLVGPGGCGKTRLAVKAAEAQLDSYPHGVFFVRLARLDSVEGIVPTVAEALGFRFHEEGKPQQQLLDYLSLKRTLLILDSFEHLLAGPEPGRRDGVGLVTEILRTAQDIKILTTSRARLNVQGEHLLPIAGMDFPDEETAEELVLSLPKVAARRQVQGLAQYSAVELFLQSARRVQPSYEPTADDLFEVGRICRLAEGMPLGILLAAAWVEMLTPAEIAAEIGRSLDFLETDLHDLPERQRSMRAVFDHSWNLLTKVERDVFQGLTVFRGGFARSAAQEVASASLRELMALVHKSLLHRTTAGRYDMHELVRSYAAEKLDRDQAASELIHDRHCSYYSAALQKWGVDLKGPRQQTALTEIHAEIENARAAWNWAVERGQVERLDRSLDGLCHFLEWRGRYEEGEAACRMATEKLGAKVSESPTASGSELLLLGRVWSIRGSFNWKLGRTDTASQHLHRSLALLEQSESDDPDVRAATAHAILEFGHVASDYDRKEGRHLYEQSLALFRELGDQYGMAQALYALGEVARLVGAYEEAKRFHEESLALRQTLGHQSGIADSLRGLSNIAVKQGRLEEGERLIRQSIAIHRDLDNRGAIADGTYYLGQTLMFLGEYDEAHAKLEESVVLYRDLGDLNGLADSYGGLSFVEWMQSRYRQARVHARMCLSLSQDTGHQFGIAVGLGMLGSVALIEGAGAEARKLLQESATIHREIGQREELGWALAQLGAVELALGNVPQARQHFYEALHTAADIRSFMTFLAVIAEAVPLLIVKGENERAVELYALASRYPVLNNAQVFDDLVGQLIAVDSASLPPEVVLAAKERGLARDLEATVAELLAEFEC